MRRRVKNRESQRPSSNAGFLGDTSFLYSKGNKNNRKRGRESQGEIEALSSLLVAFFPSEREKIEEAKERARDSKAFLRLLARKSPLMRAFIKRQLREAKKGVE
jgi:sugar/nucleoside kinase (ribokinase family)